MSNIKPKLMLSDLVNQLSVAICIVRRDYTIAMVNEYFVTRSKATTSELVGQNLLDKYPESQHFLKRKIDTAFMIESPTFSSWEQAPHVLPFYTSRPISGSEDRMFQNIEVLPIHNDDGSLEHVCLCIHDVTLQAAQHHSLKELTVKLNNEQHQLEDALNKLKLAQSQLLQSEKMASIGQLSAGIAHEINNPIGFITSNLQTLEDYFSTVKNHIQQLNTLINNCESETIIESKEKAEKKINLTYILDDLSDLIQESLEGSGRVMAIVKNLKEFSHIDSSEWNYSNLEHGLESTLKIINNEVKYNIEVEKHFSKGVPEVYCQPMQINQVFLNILVNACHAIEGKGKISIFLDKHDDDSVSIKIADTGSGIPQEILSSIFDPFFTTKPVGSGTGLGLSVSYGIVAKHKGKIEVESEVGKGSTFTILLPYQSKTTAGHFEVEDGWTLMIDYAEILLVDDEPLILKSLERQLRRKVGHIYTAQSGADAIKILMQNQNINLVITDFRMPEMDGSELVARIKSDFPEVATIMLSGQADFERVTNAFNTGALTRYLGKPWDNDELTSVIENVLDIQSKTRNRDRLTQLKNIFALNNHIEKIKEYRCKPWLLVMLDIQSMRKFNDQYGVMEANDFIHDIAKAIPKSEKLVWYRYEDKFFTFVEYHHSGYELIFNLEESSFASSKIETRIQVSIYLSDAYSWNTICAEEIARRKLDASPIDNHTYWLNDQLPNENVREFSELSLIIKDLRSNNFVAYFQPQLNLATGKIDCCEALARQKGEHGKILNPAQFLPLMEKYDLLDRLTERMLNQSLQLISRLKQQQLSIRVSVNVTAAQVESGYVKQCLHNENGEWVIGIDLLELEILETEKIVSFPRMSEQIKLLKTAGVRCAIDDFGTGYSGFESLKEIPFDVVKIDGRFIRCLGESESDDVILKSITDSATSLNMSIVAEWVENKFQYNYLKEHGCTRIQGYWVSPPLPCDDFLTFLASY